MSATMMGRMTVITTLTPASWKMELMMVVRDNDDDVAGHVVGAGNVDVVDDGDDDNVEG